MGKGIAGAHSTELTEEVLALVETAGAAALAELLGDAMSDVDLTVTFGDGRSVTYSHVPAYIAMQVCVDPSRYNELVRGQYS